MGGGIRGQGLFFTRSMYKERLSVGKIKTEHKIGNPQSNAPKPNRMVNRPEEGSPTRGIDRG